VSLDCDEFNLGRFPGLILLSTKKQIMDNSIFGDMINNLQKVAWCVFRTLIAKLLSCDSGDSCMENTDNMLETFKTVKGDVWEDAFCSFTFKTSFCKIVLLLMWKC
jgi:hypothetical protein